MKTYYLSAGNFPSIAANTIQVAKMVSAYQHYLPDIELLTLAPQQEDFVPPSNLQELFGLKRELSIRYLPFLQDNVPLPFPRDYRPPPAFYTKVAEWAAELGAELVFTRKAATLKRTLELEIPTVFESHLPWEELSELHDAAKLLGSSNLLSCVVISGPLERSFKSSPIPQEKIFVQPSGVDVHQFHEVVPTEDARNAIGLSKIDRPLVVYCGHLHQHRGIELLIEAASKLNDVHFLLVGGWDEDVKRVQRIIHEKSLSNIELVGYVPASMVPLYLYASSVLVMPYEASMDTAERCSPLKMYEYLAAGKPIVSSNLSILQQQTESFKGVSFFQAGDLSNFIETLRRSLENPVPLDIVENNRNLLFSEYSWEERARSILQKSGVISEESARES